MHGSKGQKFEEGSLTWPSLGLPFPNPLPLPIVHSNSLNNRSSSFLSVYLSALLAAGFLSSTTRRSSTKLNSLCPQRFPRLFLFSFIVLANQHILLRRLHLRAHTEDPWNHTSFPILAFDLPFYRLKHSLIQQLGRTARRGLVCVVEHFSFFLQTCIKKIPGFAKLVILTKKARNRKYSKGQTALSSSLDSLELLPPLESCLFFSE